MRTIYGMPVPFLQSPNYNARKTPRVITGICLHVMQCAEIGQAAENIGSWAQSKKSAVSWHYGVDNNSIIQHVDENDIAWACGPANGWTINIEQAGQANQTKEQWADPYSLACVDNAAKVCADIILRSEIIMNCHLTDEQVKLKRGGIFDHAAVTRVFGGGNHWDCGESYPWGFLLEQTAFWMSKGPGHLYVP